MAATLGLNHLGLTVYDLDETTAFFVDVLGWTETARDTAYPRNAITDGNIRLTLWQVKKQHAAVGFNRRQNIGLHHLALTVASEDVLNDLAGKIDRYPGVWVEFMPEPMGSGPRKHMIFTEPGGVRIELTWPGE